MYKIFVLLGMGLLLLGACATAPATGTLQVNVGGLPAAANAAVSVSGSGFSKALTASTTLSARAVGTYTVTAADVSSGGVTYSPTISGSPAKVVANATATVTVTYAINPASLGNLQVNISGVPTGASGSVSINGPGSFSQNLIVTTTLSGLVPGDYSISASNIPGAGITAGFTYKGTVSSSPTTVRAGATATVEVAYAAITGRLTVNVGGLPSGAKANLLVTRAGGFSQSLSATATLDNLEPGTYTVASSDVRAAGPIVDSLFIAPPSVDVVVGAGNAANLTRTYSARGGTGMLWVPVTKGLIGYSADQMATATAAGFTATPAGIVQMTDASGQFNRGQQVVFDATGNLYISTIFGDSIRKFTPEQLAAGGTQTPVITTGGLNGSHAMAFDGNGNLWVVNLIGSINAYTPGQLSAGGSQIPVKVVTSSTLVSPIGLAFDSSGNLWVSNNTTTAARSLVRFTPTQLAAGGNFLPADVVQIQADAFNQPAGLAFDAVGNLWLANFGGNTLLKFTPDQLNSSGSKTAAVTLTGFDGPRGLAFDNAGNLWVSEGFDMKQVSAADLLNSGNPTAAKVFSGFGEVNVGGLAFSPTPANLPIQNK